MKKLYAMLFVLLLSAAISGCNSKTEDTIPSETIEYTTQQTEVTTVPSIAESVSDSEIYELSTDKAKPEISANQRDYLRRGCPLFCTDPSGKMDQCL